jgi:aminoglycoside phosphotransferase (APT) family kinase protein
MAEPGRQRTLDPGNLEPIAAWLRQALETPSLELTGAVLLGGGAVQENWRLDVVIAEGPRAGMHLWVLRTDAAARLSVSLDRTAEAFAVKLAFDAGVKVPEPVARCEDAGVIGAPFAVQTYVSGDASARRLVRDAGVNEWGAALAGELGAQLARIHGIRPIDANADRLPVSTGQTGRVEVAKLRAALAHAGEPRPALEYILAWLDRNAPPAPAETVLVHGDFRTGNYLVEDGRLTGILDWEFAHWGDPDEDLGWICAACWRFGRNDRPVGGIAQRAPFYEAYARHSGRQVEPKRVHYWEIMAAARWGGIAALQGDRYRVGGEESIELALTGLMPSELELEALDGLKAYEQQWT